MWVTVSDTRGCSQSDTIVATNKNLTAAPTNFSISKLDPARFLGVWTAPVVDSNITIIGYRMAYRLRGTTSWTVTPLTTSTFLVLNFNGSGNPAGNYEFVAFTRYNDGVSNTSSNFSCLEAKGYNGSGNKTDITATSENNANWNIKTYPNPVREVLNVSAPEGSQIELLNIQGQTLITSETRTNDYLIDMTSYPQGVYLLRIQKDGFTTIRRVIKD